MRLDFYRARTILLTGASRGIGAAMARAVAPSGATLLLTARTDADLQAVAEDCRAAGSTVATYAHDLARPGAAHTLMERLTQDGHAVDILINNAGFGKVGPLTSFPADVWEAMATLNMTALTALTRLCLPGMVERRTGGVLNVASTGSYVPAPRFAVYTATKAYVLAFTEALHAELARTGVHVTALVPGPTDTGFADAADMTFLVGGITEDADKVARVGLRGLAVNKRVAISGALNKAMPLASRLTPKWLTLFLGHAVMKRAEQ